MTTQNPSQSDLFFEPIIEGYLWNPRFVRRDWLAEEIDHRLHTDGSRFVLLTAEPGFGKSTFMAQLAADHPDWPRYFIRRDQRTPLGDVAAHSFLLRIGYQLAALHPELFTQDRVQLAVEQRIGTVGGGGEVVGAEVKRILASPFHQKVVQIQQQVTQNQGEVIGLRIEELVIEPRLLEPAALADMALFDPARALFKLDPAQQIVILVDALDEIRYHDTAEDILRWLTGCPELPPNVRFVLSSRPSDTTLQLFSDKQAPYLRTMAIAAKEPHVLADVCTYVERLTREPRVAAELAKREGETSDMEARLASKAHGNLGYLAALARAIDDALDRQNVELVATLLDLHDLPEELDDLYAFFLHQIRAEIEVKGLAVPVSSPGSRRPLYLPAWPGVYQPLLAVLAVALAPLTPDQIKEFSSTGTDRTFVLDALGRLRQFLDESGIRYRFYHATVAEFLTDERVRERVETTDLYADPTEWHCNIATYLWETHSHDWSTCDEYGLNGLAVHLYRGKQYDHLRELISKKWMQARYVAIPHTYDGFLADVALALDTVSTLPDTDTRTIAAIRLHAAKSIVNAQMGTYTDIDLETVARLGREDEARSYALRASVPAERATRLLAVWRGMSYRADANLDVYREVLTIVTGAAKERLPVILGLIESFPPAGACDERVKLLEQLSDQCKLLAEALDNAAPRSFARLAVRLAQQGCNREFDQAYFLLQDILPRIIWPEYRAECLAQLGLGQAFLGRTEPALVSFAEAVELLNKMGHLHIRAIGLLDTATKLAQAGFHEQSVALGRTATKLVNRYRTAGTDSDRLGRIAAALYRTGQTAKSQQLYGEAISMAKGQLDYAFSGSGTIEAYLNLLLASGRAEQALPIAVQLRNAVTRGQSLCHLLSVSMKYGHDDLADQTVSQILEVLPNMTTEEWSTLFASLLDSWLIPDRITKIRSWLEKQKDPNQMHLGFSLLANRLARNGCLGEAEAFLAETLQKSAQDENRETCNEVLHRILLALARMGYQETVERLRPPLKSPAWDAALAMALAAGLMRRGMEQEACAVLRSEKPVVEVSGDAAAEEETARLLFLLVSRGRPDKAEGFLPGLLTGRWGTAPVITLIDALFQREDYSRGVQVFLAAVHQGCDLSCKEWHAPLQAWLTTLVATSQWPQTERIMETLVADPELYCLTGSVLAKAYGKAGKVREAQGIANQVVEVTVRNERKPFLWPRLLPHLASSLVASDRSIEAHAYLDRWRDVALRNNPNKVIGYRDSMPAVLTAYLSAAAEDRAIAFSQAAVRAAFRFSDDYDRDAVVHDLALAWAKAGYVGRALELGGEIGRSDWIQRTFSDLGVLLISQGALDLAANTFGRLPHYTEPEIRDKALLQLAEALARAGRPAEARQTADQIRDTQLRLQAVQAVATAYLEADALSEALGCLTTQAPEAICHFLANNAERLEEMRPGLFLEGLRAAINVAAWVRPFWHEVSVQLRS